jgi:hypothetical protein
MRTGFMRTFLSGVVLLASAGGWTWAQEPNGSPNAGAPSVYQNQVPTMQPNGPINGDAGQVDDRSGWRRLKQRGPDGSQRPDQPNFYSGGAPPNLPAQFVIPSGTFVTIRVNQVISSDHSQPGDAFSASLVKPIVVDGFVVADRGQTLAGRVAETAKAGMVKGVSRLGIELTDLSLVDGTQVPLRSQLITYQGPTSIGRDATAIGTTAAIGAMIGGIEGGPEAGLGAAAGAGAALIGVLLTRGHPTIISPEAVMTFRVEVPIAVSTTRAPQAFRPVGYGDYNQPGDQSRAVFQGPGPGPAPAPYYPGWGGWGAGWGYPGWGGYYYGPSFGIGFGYGYGYGHGYYGHGYGRGYGHHR